MREILIEKASKIGIVLDELAIDRLMKYQELLLFYNKQFNLTAITDPYEVIIKHFIDSMTAMDYIPSGSSVVDVGTGAGFPGMVIAIISPSCNVTLIDSLKKRVNFLEEVIRSLALTNVKAYHLRAEEGALGELRESFDVGVARALSTLPTIIEYVVPYLKIGGLLIAFKGDYEEEIASSTKALKALGSRLETIKSFILDGEYKRSLIVIKKLEKTQKSYPRAGNKAKNMPL